MAAKRKKLADMRGGKKKHKRDPHDWYVETEECVEQLLQRHEFKGPIYDPCAGSGTILRVARRFGLKTIGTDLIDRGFPGVEGGQDFLGLQGNIFAASAREMIFNPPFGYGIVARAFLMRALTLPNVEVIAAVLPDKLLFGRATWLLYSAYRPNFVHPLIPRPSMPPGKKFFAGKIKAEGGQVDYFWAVWDRRLPSPAATIIEPLIGPDRRKKAATVERQPEAPALPLLTHGGAP